MRDTDAPAFHEPVRLTLLRRGWCDDTSDGGK
jgi:hypothetical protein